MILGCNFETTDLRLWSLSNIHEKSIMSLPPKASTKMSRSKSFINVATGYVNISNISFINPQNSNLTKKNQQTAFQAPGTRVLAPWAPGSEPWTKKCLGGRTPHGDWGGKNADFFLFLFGFWAWITIILYGLLDRLSSHQWLGRSDGLKGVQALLFMHVFSRDSAIETYFISTFLVSHVLKPSTSLLLQGSFNGEFFRPGLAHIKI